MYRIYKMSINYFYYIEAQRKTGEKSRNTASPEGLVSSEKPSSLPQKILPLPAYPINID